MPLQALQEPSLAPASAASSAWIHSHRLFSDRKRAAFVQGCYELLASYTYPYAGPEQLRTCCDFVNLLFVLDDISDEEDGAGARRIGDTFLSALRYPAWDDGSALAKMTREFRSRLLHSAGPGCVRRFLRDCEGYIDAVAQEAGYRERGVVLDAASYQALRRENSAVRPCFALIEYCLGVDLPDEVFDDPAFMVLYWATADMVNWSNDIYSYSVEQAQGIGGNNIVTVLMHEQDADVQASVNLAGDLFDALMDRFLEARDQLPSWGSDVDEAVRMYVKGLEHWTIGNLEWSFDTQRYFGPLHAEIQRTRVVPIRAHEEFETD
ncbi:terpenoid synthase [Fomitopsis serialis]|uniref:terpenoid synthase n=1 Tax=Fomitopsis serialis TaxID=139415 RepID=UPI002007E3E2|nr:terpenoid synthase [Neoantrodia serialis]KAH9934236.1 terpenoid synthase [Neoantrodia serialis]